LGDMVLITSLTLTVIKRECEISTVQADRLYNIAYGNVCNFKLTTTVETIANCVLNDAAATSTVEETSTTIASTTEQITSEPTTPTVESSASLQQTTTSITTSSGP